MFGGSRAKRFNPYRIQQLAILFLLHLSVWSVFIYLGLLPYFGAIVGSVLTIFFAKVLPGWRMIKYAIFLESIASLALYFLFIVDVITIWSLILPVVVFFIGHALSVSNTITLALSETHDKANASATVNCIGIGVGALGTLALSICNQYANHVMVFPALFCICIGIMIMVFLLARKQLDCISLLNNGRNSSLLEEYDRSFN